jgi:hypothetical protein
VFSKRLRNPVWGLERRAARTQGPESMPEMHMLAQVLCRLWRLSTVSWIHRVQDVLTSRFLRFAIVPFDPYSKCVWHPWLLFSEYLCSRLYPDQRIYACFETELLESTPKHVLSNILCKPVVSILGVADLGLKLFCAGVLMQVRFLLNRRQDIKI